MTRADPAGFGSPVPPVATRRLAASVLRDPTAPHRPKPGPHALLSRRLTSPGAWAQLSPTVGLSWRGGKAGQTVQDDPLRVLVSRAGARLGAPGLATEEERTASVGGVCARVLLWLELFM